MVAGRAETGARKSLHYGGILMGFDWAEYFHVAQELSEQTKNSLHRDARLRSAISRSYYAAFGKARDHLRLKDKLVEPRIDRTGQHINPHAYVAETFKNSADKERREIGVTLERMRLLRNKADYEGTFDMLAPFTRTSLLMAKNVLIKLRKL